MRRTTRVSVNDARNVKTAAVICIQQFAFNKRRQKEGKPCERIFYPEVLTTALVTLSARETQFEFDNLPDQVTDESFYKDYILLIISSNEHSNDYFVYHATDKGTAHYKINSADTTLHNASISPVYTLGDSHLMVDIICDEIAPLPKEVCELLSSHGVNCIHEDWSSRKEGLAKQALSEFAPAGLKPVPYKAHDVVLDPTADALIKGIKDANNADMLNGDVVRGLFKLAMTDERIATALMHNDLTVGCDDERAWIAQRTEY